MSSSVNYHDLYEEFLNLTSSPRNPNYEDCQSEPLQFTQALINKPTKQESPPDNSPLRALLTPPSPISTSYSFPATTFLSLRLVTDIEHEGGLGTSDYKMCDSNETSAANVAVPTSGSGRHVPTETNNSSQDNVQSPYFQSLAAPQPTVPSSVAGMQGGLQHNLATIQNHSMIMDAHQQHQVPIHHQLNPYANQHLQHQLMEGHHHQQAHQINISQQQNNGHQFSPQFSLPASSHIAHPNVHSNQQTLVPFGMNFNSNVVGNGGQYINNQVGAFPLNNHHQLSNQQQAHSHQLQQQHASCFMQHSCMHMQHQPVVALNAPRSPSTVSWMSHQTSSVPISGSVGNACSGMSPGMGVTKVAIPTIHHPGLPDPNALPGGLEHLWKKVPVECQRIITPQDIPDSARCRGYFTVCELLQLKRSLIMRLGCGGVPVPMPIKAQPVKNTILTKKDKEESKRERGSKKGNNQNHKNQTVGVTKPPEESYGNSQRYENKQEIQPSRQSEINGEENGDGNIEQDMDDTESTFGEQMIAIANIKNEEIVIHTNMPPITGVCVAGAVKDAMNTLTSDGNNTSADGAETEVDNNNAEEQNAQEQIESSESGHEMDSGENAESNGLSRIPHSQSDAGSRITGEQLAMLPTLPPISDILPKKQQAPEDNSTDPTKETLVAAPENENNEMTVEEKERQKQIQLALVPISNTTTTAAPTFPGTNTVNINTSGTTELSCTPMEIRASGPPPPFRTSTLVLKLLQIGGYTIRSFSSLNPNRIRVLFNTHRMTYECQLPIIRTLNPNPGAHLMRKILTVDIGFEQISVIRFGADTLFMRVEGAPLLTLAYSPALEEPSGQVLTPADQTLLEQIDRGQLKLSPCHQLYFLNERLVQQLESQFREHPRFRHLLLEDSNSEQPPAQKRLKMS